MVYRWVTVKPPREDFKEKLDRLELWNSPFVYFLIPFIYIIDYFSHAWICLLFAFTVAGLIYEFVPKLAITKYIGKGGGLFGYITALLFAPLLAVCSCTIIPIFGGLLYAGAGIGPAITFLLLAPAASILTIIMTGEMISWDIAGMRLVASTVVALIAGLTISKTPWGISLEKDSRKTNLKSSSNSAESVELPLDEKLYEALKFAGYLAKKILPFYIIGLVGVSYFSAFISTEIVEKYLRGVSGVLIASLLGGPLYTPTLVEIAVGHELFSKGMSKGALLSWLMGQPYDIVNAVTVSKITGWKIVLTYTVIAWIGSVVFGIVYGLLSGSL